PEPAPAARPAAADAAEVRPQGRSAGARTGGSRGWCAAGGRLRPAAARPRDHADRLTRDPAKEVVTMSVRSALASRLARTLASNEQVSDSQERAEASKNAGCCAVA